MKTGKAGPMVKMPANLMGIDVGFSKTPRSTGIACLEGDHVPPERAGTAWISREAKIPKGFHASVISKTKGTSSKSLATSWSELTPLSSPIRGDEGVGHNVRPKLP